MASHPEIADTASTNALSRLAAGSARWSATHPWRAIALWFAMVAAAVSLVFLIPTVGTESEDYYLGGSGQASAWIDESGIEFPDTERVLITPVGRGQLDLTEAQSAADALATQWSELDEVEAVIPLQPSPDNQAALTGVQFKGGTTDASQVSAATLQVANRFPGLELRQAGSFTVNDAIDAQIASDLRSAEGLSIPITLTLMLLAFGTLIAAGIPVLLAVCSVAATIGIAAPLSHVIPAEPTVNSMIVLIGMAVGVDYSLFYTKRAAKERAQGRSTLDAVEIAALTSGHAVLVSGAAVIACMGGLFIVGQATFNSLAAGAIVVVAIAVVGSITLLPALLGGLGQWVDRPRIPLLWRLGARVSGLGISRRVLGPAIDHPRSALIAATLALAALAIPAASLQLHTSSAEILPESIDEVETANAIRMHYPAEGPTVTVVARATQGGGGGVVAALDSLSRRAEGESTVAAIGDIENSTDSRTAIMDITLDDQLSDDDVDQAIVRLREDLVPAAFAGVAADGAVGGAAADNMDYVDRQTQRLPWVVSAVLGITFLMMLAAFRSLPIALISTALNLLSLGAAFGVLTMVFDYGWGISLLGVSAPGFVVDWIPLFVLVVLVGLSMDYHVFVLSRVRELVATGLPTHVAVRQGVIDTAGVVTSAAAVMISVFSIFAMLSLMEMKMLGVGLATSILIDATIIRLVMLPAALVLLGERAWWPSILQHPTGQRIQAKQLVEHAPRRSTA